MKLKKNEDQNVDVIVLPKRENEIIRGDRGKEKTGREREEKGKRSSRCGQRWREVQRVRKLKVGVDPSSFYLCPELILCRNALYPNTARRELVSKE